MTLRGDRCVLRRWRAADIGPLVRHANNINVSRYLRDRFPYPYTRKDARAPFPSIRPPGLRQPKREVYSPHHVGRDLKGKPRQVIEQGAADDGPFDGIGPAMPKTGEQGAGRTEVACHWRLVP